MKTLDTTRVEDHPLVDVMTGCVIADEGIWRDEHGVTHSYIEQAKLVHRGGFIGIEYQISDDTYARLVALS